MLCAQCRNTVSITDRFCPTCGLQLKVEPAPPVRRAFSKDDIPTPIRLLIVLVGLALTFFISREIFEDNDGINPLEAMEILVAACIALALLLAAAAVKYLATPR